MPIHPHTDLWLQVSSTFVALAMRSDAIGEAAFDGGDTITAAAEYEEQCG